MGKAKQGDLTPSRLFWQSKPWWCQPWSIVLTGSSALAVLILSYFRFHVPLWLVVPAVLAILCWWILFLVIVPSSSDLKEQ